MSTEKTIWDYFKSKGLNDYACAGILGNLKAESGLSPTNLQNTYNTKFGMSDAEYTAAVDNGSYTNFVRDSGGYGLAQWTFWTRKQNLLVFARTRGTSIGDLNMQLDFLYKELSENYSSALASLRNATSVLEASNVMLLKFEKPADQSEAVQKKRASYAQTYYDKYASKGVEVSMPKIMIDPGHFEGVNTMSCGYSEGTQMWKLSQMLIPMLKAYGFTVSCTKKSINNYPKTSKGEDYIEKRGIMASGYDLELSLHTNACATASVNRPVIIYPVSGKYKDLAADLGYALQKCMGLQTYQIMYKWNSKGNADYYGVIRGAASVGVPCLIIEHTFHTNPTMAQWMKYDANLKLMAQCVADTVAEYFGMKQQITTGWVYSNGAYYYYDANGKMVTNKAVAGEGSFAGYYYYCGADGKVVTNTTITVNGVAYRADSIGRLFDADDPQAAERTDTVPDIIDEEEIDMTQERFKELFDAMRSEWQDNDQNEWEVESCQWAVDKGIIKGSSTDEFNGMWHDMLTRSQMCIMLHRFAKLLGVE